MLSSTSPSGRLPRKWTVAEDQRLRIEVEAQMIQGEVKDWCRIAAKLPGRTNKDCRKRWVNSVEGGLKKGQWSKTEDVQLVRGVDQYGQRWTLVASVVGSRSADQCAKRWQQSLDPELDRSEWQDADDNILIDAVQRLGRHWKDIQSHHFPGRSKNCIKNRYTVLVRRYQNGGNPLPHPPGTPERSPDPAPYDDDVTSYRSSVYGDLLYPSQVSTPDTPTSWSEYPNWTSQEPFNTTSTAPMMSSAQEPLSVNVSQAHWGWATTSVDHSPMMQMATPSHAHAYEHATLSPYESHYPAMILPSSPRYPGCGGAARAGPTSSPICRSPSYQQDPQAMSHYMRYNSGGGDGDLRNPAYQY